MDLQVTDFVRRYDDTRKATGVLDDRDAIDFLETFVHYASTAHVRESYIHVKTAISTRDCFSNKKIVSFFPNQYPNASLVKNKILYILLLVLIR